jgi:hypothetical protein
MMDSYQWLPWINFFVLAVNLYLVWRYTTYTKGIMDQNREQAELSLRPIVYLKDLVYRPSKVPIPVLGFELRNIGETAAKYKVTIKSISVREKAGNDFTPVLPPEIGNEHVILPYKDGMGAPHIFELGLTERSIRKGSGIHAELTIEYWRVDSVAPRKTYTYSSTVDVFGFKAKPGPQETQQRGIIES